MKVKFKNKTNETLVIRLIPSTNAEVNPLTQTGVVRVDTGVLSMALAPQPQS